MPIESAETPIAVLPPVSLPDLDGAPVDLATYFAGHPGVVIFTCNHCPYAQHIETAVGRIAREHPTTRIVAICSNDAQAHPADGVDGLREQVVRAGWEFPYLVDESQEVARTFGAVCTPDCYVFTPTGSLCYRGAIDDTRPSSGVTATGEYLIAAITAAGGGTPPPAGRPSLGCGIKWRMS